MGICFHRDITEEGKNAKLQNSKIEQDLCEHAKAETNVVKILMLGKLKVLIYLKTLDSNCFIIY